jgi:hypothetical protein
MNFRILSILLLLALPAACTHAPPPCTVGTPSVETHLYFGLNKPDGGGVTPTEWRQFVVAEIAPRFPEGFTVLEGRGHWLGEKSKKLEAENSRIVIRLHHGSADENAAINKIADTYKKVFSQESVLRIDRPACAAF